MNLINYYSYIFYCDGCVGMEDFICFVISWGFMFYGIFLYVFLLFLIYWMMEWDCMDDYLDEFIWMKEKYVLEIELVVGLEIDYLNEDSNFFVWCF